MVLNKTRDKVIAQDCKVLYSVLSKAIGLMFSFKPRPLVFVFDKEQHIHLHMFFVFFPIDVLFLDKDKKVVEIKENFLPFTVYNPRNKALYVIELPMGSIRSSDTKVGDVIEF